MRPENGGHPLSPEDYHVINHYAVPEHIDHDGTDEYDLERWHLILEEFKDEDGRVWANETSGTVYSPEEVLAIVRQKESPHAA